MTFLKIKDLPFSKISYCVSQYWCPNWGNRRRHFTFVISNLRFGCSLKNLVRYRHLCMIPFGRAFLIWLELLALIYFCFFGICLSRISKKISSDSFSSASLISVFSSSLFSSKLKDCSWKNFWFLISIINFRYSHKNFVEVRNTHFNSVCLLKTLWLICKKQIYAW